MVLVLRGGFMSLILLKRLIYVFGPTCMRMCDVFVSVGRFGGFFGPARKFDVFGPMRCDTFGHAEV